MVLQLLRQLYLSTFYRQIKVRSSLETPAVFALKDYHAIIHFINLSSSILEVAWFLCLPILYYGLCQNLTAVSVMTYHLICVSLYQFVLASAISLS